MKRRKSLHDLSPSSSIQCSSLIIGRQCNNIRLSRPDSPLFPYPCQSLRYVVFELTRCQNRYDTVKTIHVGVERTTWTTGVFNRRTYQSGIFFSPDFDSALHRLNL